MLAVTNSLHESFPNNNKLYRIYWGGEVLLPETPSSTPRARIWLREIDEYGAYLNNSPIVQVTESVGAIPRLALGSCWRNGRSSRPKYRTHDRPEIFEIETSGPWPIVKAGDSHSWYPRDPITNQNHCWINPSDMRLLFQTSHNRKVYGHLARVIPTRTTTGQELIIPSYEIFRSFLGNTTDLSLALLSNKWDALSSKFVLAQRQSTGPNGLSWDLDLAPGVPHAAVPCLAMLSFVGEARRAANFIYPALTEQGPITQPAWISAFPPIMHGRFRIRAHTVRLPSRNALLVTQIVSFDLPITPAELSYSVDVLTVPTGTPTEGQPEPRTVIQSSRRSVNVTKPGDRRPGQRLFHLPSMSAKWAGLPIPRRRARRMTTLPIPDITRNALALPPTSVSVGEPGVHRSPAPARFTPQEELEIEDRFQAIRDLVEELISDGLIESAHDYPLVRPAPPEIPTYCEFPTNVADKQLRWSIVHSPFPRARLALVLELTVGERQVYWIETEATSSNKGHHSLAIEMVNGGQLDEGMLTALLDICADAKGVWPQKLPIGEGTLLAERARHSVVGDRFSKNVMLLPFARLERKKHRLIDIDSDTDISAVLERGSP